MASSVWPMEEKRTNTKHKGAVLKHSLQATCVQVGSKLRVCNVKAVALNCIGDGCFL
jgi:hypothetical protein